MLLDPRILIYFIVYTASALEQDLNFIDINDLREREDFLQYTNPKTHDIQEDKSIETAERVTLQLFYETMCPYSIDFYINGFVSVVEKLSPYLIVQTNPYGKAKTIEGNGTYTFKCQHGPRECYGNKLHACAIDALPNTTQAVLFNSCMMKKGGFDGSTDKTADECGNEQNVDASPIKECANGVKGTQLLKKYGDASKKINLQYVPCIFINGNEEKDRDNFMKDVCAAFTNPPPECQKQTKILPSLDEDKMLYHPRVV